MGNANTIDIAIMDAMKCKYLLDGYLYIYDKEFASRRVKHFMNHGKKARTRKKNWNRYYSEWSLFVKRRFGK